tara:strand:- start:688 stop:1278 length:591 start_codon:yes stop_codon:yes gene_type:complete
MNIEKVKLSKVKSNPNNPRLIKDDKFKKLVNSIKEFPEMLKIRPIVVNEDMIVLGGNMRLKACRAAGLKEVFIIKASELTEDQQKEFVIKDNTGFGEWDWDTIANEWDSADLIEWGLDIEKKELEKEMPENGEIEFTEELFLEHNYVVLYFDNNLDWEVAKDKLGIKKTKSPSLSENSQKSGMGRVIKGNAIIERL